MIMIDVIIGVTKDHLSSGQKGVAGATKSACGYWFWILHIRRRSLESVTCLKCQRTKLYKIFEEANKE